MGIFNRFKKTEIRAMITADDGLQRALRMSEISVAEALNIPAFSACLDFIANTVAELPIKLYRENQDGEVEELKKDKRVKLLNDQTGDLLDPYQMRQAFVRDYFLYGDAYIYPEMYRNEVLSLRYIENQKVCPIVKDTDPIYKDAKFLIGTREFYHDEVMRICRNTGNGVRGKSIIDEHNQMLTATYKAMIFEKYLLSNGGNKKGFLKSSRKLSDEAIEKLKESWQTLYSNNGSGMMILNEGLDFKESSNTSVEMQLQQSKNTNNTLICQMFGLSPDVVSGKATDDVYVSAVKTAITPIVTAIQTALNGSLLLPSERTDFYFVLDMNELLKGDILKRYQAYQIGLANSFLQIDDVRYKEDLKPLGFNYIRLGLNDVLLNPVTKEIYTPNTNQTKIFGENPAANLEKLADGGIMEERYNNGKNYTKDEHGRFTGSTGGGGSGGSSGGGKSNKTVEKSAESGTLKLEDINIHRSVGAKSKNYDVMDLTTGKKYHFAEGTKIQNVEVFAGKKSKTPFRKAEKYAEKYGGNPKDWQHAKGHGILETSDGDRPAEVHWVQCEGIGKKDFFIKRWEDE